MKNERSYFMSEYKIPVYYAFVSTYISLYKVFHNFIYKFEMNVENIDGNHINVGNYKAAILTKQ